MRLKGEMSLPTYFKLFLCLLCLTFAYGVVQLNSPTQVEVFSNATTVITFELSSTNGFNVTIDSYSIDSSYPGRTELGTYISLGPGDDQITIAQGAPVESDGVTISLFLSAGSETGFGTFTLIIRGPNRAPVLSPPYAFSIREDAANGDLVGTIGFTDENPNSVSFVSSLPTIFNFQPNTNRILVYNSDILDREIQDTYTFTISATDNDGLSSSANVTVTLTDANDQTLIINNTGISIQVPTIVEMLSTGISYTVVSSPSHSASQPTIINTEAPTGSTASILSVSLAITGGILLSLSILILAVSLIILCKRREKSPQSHSSTVEAIPPVHTPQYDSIEMHSGHYESMEVLSGHYESMDMLSGHYESMDMLSGHYESMDMPSAVEAIPPPPYENIETFSGPIATNTNDIPTNECPAYGIDNAF